MEAKILYKGAELEPIKEFNETDGLIVDVEFNYQPGEPMVMYYPDGSGYPGSSDEVEVTRVYYKEKEITDLFTDFTEIENELFNQSAIIT